MLQKVSRKQLKYVQMCTVHSGAAAVIKFCVDRYHNKVYDKCSSILVKGIPLFGRSFSLPIFSQLKLQELNPGKVDIINRERKEE